MAEAAQMFLFLYKCKYRRKARAGVVAVSAEPAEDEEEKTGRRRRLQTRRTGGAGQLLWSLLVWTTLLQCAAPLETAAASSQSSIVGANASACDLDSCLNGNCVNGSCLCREGWQGPNCQYCASKVRLVLAAYFLSYP